MDKQILLRNLEPPSSKVDVVLDTDAYNEIDDQFAIAYLMRNTEKLRVKAIYAAPFSNEKSAGPLDGMEKSYGEIKKVLSLLNCPQFTQIYKGSGGYLPDEKTPVSSPAAEHLAELALQYSPENPLYVVAIGAITNIASAILRNPAITENIVVVWLGGHALHWHDCKEFNLFQDVAAARVVFDSAVPLVQLPCCGVVSAFTISEAELQKWLLGGNEICDYLARNTIEEVRRYAQGCPWTRVIWDVTAVAWLLDKRFFLQRIEKRPIVEYDGTYTMNPARHEYQYIYHVHRDALVQDLFTKYSCKR